MKIKLNEKLVDIFFAGLEDDCLEDAKKLVKEGTCYLVPRTGEIIKDGKGTGIFTGYFSDAYFYDHAFTKYERENLYEDGFWCDNKETLRIQTNITGSDGWNLLYNEETKEEKKVYRFYVLFDNEEQEAYDIWLPDEDYAYALAF